MRTRIRNFFGLFLIFFGACLVLPLIIALACRETSSIRAFLITIAICLVAGFINMRISKGDFISTKLRLRDSYFIVAMSWFLALTIGALPYVLSGAMPSYVDAFFETCSGFSTTGATILTEVESLPRSILFWRALTQWLGGMGIMVLFMALLPSFGIKGQNIASAETPGPIFSKVSSRFSGTAQSLYIAYIILTGMLVIMLMLGGVSLYDAVCHAFTALATGGFSTYNAGVTHFDSDYVYWMLTIFTFLAGTNFGLFFVLIAKGPRAMFRDEEFRLYAKIMGIAIVLVMISLMTRSGYTSYWRALTDASFEVVTMMTTTGYSIANYVEWTAFAQIIIIIVMLVGASSSSTAGGLKVVRVLVSLRLMKHFTKRKLHGNMVDEVKLDGKRLPSETISQITSFITMYIIVLIVATFLVSFSSGQDLVTDFTATLSCISNVGPGMANVGPLENFAFYPDFAKVVLALTMIIGRLELITFFIVFTKYFWNNHAVQKNGFTLFRRRNETYK
ncbi:MAG: TrkH family potassium uptake protein [Mogibacterium sp.]|nr:TrkH family potassium uptake protein [Mogibacterium sp.]